MPEVLTELSLPAMPDYIDDLLLRTARMPQRPGWSLLERWFPVSTFTATMPSRWPAVRPLVAVAVLLALIAAAIALYAGSQSQLPPLFGPARNGLVLAATSAGDISAVDPVTGSVRTIVTGPGLCCTSVSPDGRRISYLHIPAADADPTGLTFANVDGSAASYVPGDQLKGLGWTEWAPSGDRMLATTDEGPVILDTRTAKATILDVPIPVLRASWIGTSGDILLTQHQGDTQMRVFRLAAGSTKPTLVTTLQYAVNPPLISPDGSRFLYFIWGTEDRLHGKLHVFDLATNTDRAITEESFADSKVWENPVWSPDGSLIASELYDANGLYQVAVVAATGGTPVLVGPKKPEMTEGAAIRFSPDGTALLVTYRFDKTTWLLPTAGGEGRQVNWATTEDLDWQRLAR
jgi:dipeptidyl aminopeptidase/acylaminoacyl peptidase